MFNNQKYITRGIAEELPLELQMFLWTMIIELENKSQLDYLQVFKLDTMKHKV